MTDPARFVPDLIRFEGSIPWMYRDELGYVTVGVGNLLHNADEACALPFQTAGAPSSPGDIQRRFLSVVACPKGELAQQYRFQPRIELTDAAISDLLAARLRNEFLPGLERLLPAFESFPAPAQSALVDMAFNLGVHGLSTFKTMLADIGQGAWHSAAGACHSSTARPERNDWRRDLFLSCA